MTKFYRTLALGFAAIAMLSASAKNFNTLCVHLNDGSSVDVPISETTVLQFSADMLTVGGSESEISFERSNIRSFVHKYTSGIDTVATDAKCEFNGDSLEFSDLPEGSVIQIFNTDGVSVRKISAKGNLSLSLEGLTPGTYIVAAGNSSFKILIK